LAVFDKVFTSQDHQAGSTLKVLHSSRIVTVTTDYWISFSFWEYDNRMDMVHMITTNRARSREG
jgi:hypothetical protein